MKILVSGSSGLIGSVMDLLKDNIDVLSDVALGMALSILVVEFTKRFSSVLPHIFEGNNWLLKVRLYACAVSGVSTGLLSWYGEEDGIIIAVAALVSGFGSPFAYDLAYKVAPALMDKLMSKISGSKAVGQE